MKTERKTKFTFWELLSEYKIEIPKIQRDYAQGRQDKEVLKIVDKFLNNIKKSIITGDELNLDFIYGRVQNGALIPLDGQQRLTTLFLIHWYLALKENLLSDDVKSTLLKFTYETRISSEDFCKNLVQEGIEFADIQDNLSETIIDSKWYFLSWELDPTVSAMLNMLDTIHERFKDIEEDLFIKLRDTSSITFLFLPLEQFKLTDELYIKMNARGKPLTEFENFKASFSQFLKNTPENKSKLDNEWLDIFWNMEKNSTQTIITENVDSKFFTFFKNVTINFHAEQYEIKNLDTYDLFDIYEEVYTQNSYVSNLIDILNALTIYEDKEKIFSEFLTPKVSYWQRLRFYALSQFFIKKGAVSTTNKVIFDRWMRVTTNLINNTLIQSTENYKNAILSILGLSDHIDDIYDFLATSYESIPYFYLLQKKEEGLKARLILDDPTWEQLFIEIEKHPYFDGQIGFILNYASDGTDYAQNIFQNYSRILSSLFSNKYKESHDFLFQRALLTKGDYLPIDGNNHTFCNFEEGLRAKRDNWRKVFNHSTRTEYLKQLLNDIDLQNILSSLKSVVSSSTIADWRKIIIDNPQTIAYCQKRQIRKGSQGRIYLLSKVQMNGRHKELFSWDFFKKNIKDVSFMPFSKLPWYWESTSYEEPCIIIEDFRYEKNNYQMEVSHEGNHVYKIRFLSYTKPLLPDSIRDLLETLGFIGPSINLPENEIKDKLHEVSNALLAIDDDIEAK